MPTINIAKFSSVSQIPPGTAERCGVGIVSGDLYIREGSAAAIKIADAGDLPLIGVAASYKMIGGQTSIDATAAATATVVTGLALVVAVMAGLDSDPVDNAQFVSATIGDQAGAPAAGSITLKVFKVTNVANDVTPIAATAGTHKVNWIAIGT